MHDWRKLLAPVAVVAVICIVITGALAVTNSVTKPIIEEKNREAQEKARQELLPEADEFTAIEVDVSNVIDVYRADNGAGTVVTSTAKGYGGVMTVMVAFEPGGAIQKIKVTDSKETQGIGSKVTCDPAFWSRFEGLESRTLMIGRNIDGLSGATVSSKALVSAVNAAIKGYQAAELRRGEIQ